MAAPNQSMTAEQVVAVLDAVAGLPWPLDEAGFARGVGERLGWHRVPERTGLYATGLPRGAEYSSTMIADRNVDEVSMNLLPLSEASPERDAELNDVFADHAGALVAAFGKPFVKRSGKQGLMRWRRGGAVVELGRSRRTISVRIWPDAGYEWMSATGLV